MLTNILTYLKAMSKLITIPKFYGPLATVIFTVAYHMAAVTFGFSITLSWLWLFMAAGVFIGGLRAGLLCAAFTVAYAVYAIPMDTSRLIQLAINTPAAAALIGWQTRTLRRSLAELRTALERAERNQAKADLVDSANGNIDKLRTALKMLDDLLMGWDVLADNARRNLIIETRAHLATLILLVFGWRKLAQEKRYAEGESDE